MLKVIFTAYKKPGLTDEEFNKYWKEIHGPLSRRIDPGLRRYTQNHLIKIPGVKYEIDGFAECWWDDIEAYKSFLAWRKTKQGKELEDDEARFLDTSRQVGYCIEEHVVL